MLIISLILIICFVAIVILFKAQPNLFMFQLIENVFWQRTFRQKGLNERFVCQEPEKNEEVKNVT